MGEGYSNSYLDKNYYYPEEKQEIAEAVMDDIEDNVRERNLDKEDGAIANADN
jgi:hypothetical protein